MCCISIRYAPIRCKLKCWLTLNQNNVSEWEGMSTCELLFQWIRYWSNRKQDTTISLKSKNFFSSWRSWNIVHMAWNNKYSLLTHSNNLMPIFFLLPHAVSKHKYFGKVKKNTGVRISVYISGQEQEALYVPHWSILMTYCLQSHSFISVL
jgi:hypothetical protein